MVIDLSEGKDVVIPNYNFKTCLRDEPGISIKCNKLVMIEGIFALYDEFCRDKMDLKIFVDTDNDIRLGRRLIRDIVHRGREVEGVLKAYNRFVKHAFDDFIKPVS